MRLLSKKYPKNGSFETKAASKRTLLKPNSMGCILRSLAEWLMRAPAPGAARHSSREQEKSEPPSGAATQRLALEQSEAGAVSLPTTCSRYPSTYGSYRPSASFHLHRFRHPNADLPKSSCGLAQSLAQSLPPTADNRNR